MKLPSKTFAPSPGSDHRTAKTSGPSTSRPAANAQVNPQNVFAGHCEQICSRIIDPVLRERCLRTCGY